jgi:hypothetical protein
MTVAGSSAMPGAVAMVEADGTRVLHDPMTFAGT